MVASTLLRLEENNYLLPARGNEQGMWSSRSCIGNELTPTPAASAITAIVSCTLAASLLVAVLTISAKRSLKRYATLDFDAADPGRGQYQTLSAFYRSVPRIFELFVEGLLLALQASLLVVTCVLANNLWNRDRWVASLTVAGAEILCTVLITSATIGPALLGVSDGVVMGSIKKPLLQTLTSTKPNVNIIRQRTLPERQPSAAVSHNGNLEKLEIISDHKDVPLIFGQQPVDWSGSVSDSLYITWMFDRPIDSDETTAVLDFITEVVWHSGVYEVPLAKVFEILDKCFDHSKGTPTLIHRLRDRAYRAGKAFVHLSIQRKCIGEEKGDLFEGLRGTRGPYSSRSYDSDLDSILNIVDRLLGTPQQIDWTDFTFSEPHQCWLSHILLYRAWDHLCYVSELPDDVEAFIAHAFSTTSTHLAVIADCFFIISLVAGVPLHVDDLAVDDKR